MAGVGYVIVSQDPRNFIVNIILEMSILDELKRKQALEDLKNSLSIEQIEEFLLDMGGEPIRKGDTLISRTICHGGQSHKLYYYDNTKLFKCYTDCPEDSFDIFQLVLKIKKLAGEQITYWTKDAIQSSRSWELPDAVHYIAIYYGLEAPNENFSEKRIELQDWEIFSKLEAKKLQKNRNQIVSLKVFKDDFLKNMAQPRIIPWEKEGITPEIMKIHNICYDSKNQGIVIPHYDINNNLIGIRERTLIKENEVYGKYIPATINGKMYNHPLSFNLYNINISKDNIRNIKKVIVFEGEKSCLLYGSYFGLENDISVAACGSNLINYQVELLLSLGVQEIIIGFDRQYQELGDDDCRKWTKKLTQINNKYGSKVQISFLWDKEHVLNYKDSPIDQGPEVFIELFKNRIQI